MTTTPENPTGNGEKRTVNGAVLCPLHARVVQITGEYGGTCGVGEGSWLNGAGQRVWCDVRAHPERAERYAAKVRDDLSRKAAASGSRDGGM